MNLIRLLPDAIANQIAAGEVVQRPASVVKELLENAIDSGANHIKLLVKDSGKSLIQVMDNGCGMNEADARMAFERHATSKITQAADLFQLNTKGFRGEALASIAAVAQVELKTKCSEDELANRIIIEGSEVQLQEFCTSTNGSSFAVKNLFYNTPARRNFLKSDAVEFRHITEEFIRVALPHPDIHFQLLHNQHTIYDLPAAGLRQRIVNVMGKNYNERLVPIQEESLMLNIGGFIGKAVHAKKTRGEQYLFVNRRFIKSNYFNHAIAQAYGDLIEQGAFPSYFLMLELEPDRIDVNIHPTKTEIKFQDERALYQLIQASVKKSLGVFNVKPSIDFDVPNIPITPIGKKDDLKVPQININPSYNPFKGGATTSKASTPNIGKHQDLDLIEKEFKVDWQKEESVRPTVETEDGQHSMWQAEPNHQQFSGAPLMQLDNQYILTKIKSGFLLIDQQRAHQRILFERYLAKLAMERSGGQQQLFPERLQIQPKDYLVLEGCKESLEKIGLQFEFFSKDEITINALPEGLEMSGMTTFMEEFLNHMHAPKVNAGFGYQEKLAFGLAYSGSIRKGRKLSDEEMQSLIGDLFSCSNPKQAPNGKCCSVKMELSDIEKLFS